MNPAVIRYQKCFTSIVAFSIHTISICRSSYYRDVISYIPIVCCVIAFVAIILVGRRESRYGTISRSESEVIPRGSQWTSYGTLQGEMFDRFSTTLTDTPESSLELSIEGQAKREAFSQRHIAGLWFVHFCFVKFIYCYWDIVLLISILLLVFSFYSWISRSLMLLR